MLSCRYPRRGCRPSWSWSGATAPAPLIRPRCRLSTVGDETGKRQNCMVSSASITVKMPLPRTSAPMSTCDPSIGHDHALRDSNNKLLGAARHVVMFVGPRRWPIPDLAARLSCPRPRGAMPSHDGGTPRTGNMELHVSGAEIEHAPGFTNGGARDVKPRRPTSCPGDRDPVADDHDPAKCFGGVFHLANVALASGLHARSRGAAALRLQRRDRVPGKRGESVVLLAAMQQPCRRQSRAAEGGRSWHVGNIFELLHSDRALNPWPPHLGLNLRMRSRKKHPQWAFSPENPLSRSGLVLGAKGRSSWRSAAAVEFLVETLCGTRNQHWQASPRGNEERRDRFERREMATGQVGGDSAVPRHSLNPRPHA